MLLLKKICIVDRPLNDWMTDDIRALKIIRRKNEVIWRKNPLCINLGFFLGKLYGSETCY